MPAHRSSESSRDRLIVAAIDLFGRRGLEATSTREIAKAARVNIAGIAYHFGGKNQLYLACAEHIAVTLKAGLAMQSQAQMPGLAPEVQLQQTIAALATLMLVTPAVAPFARFVLREHMDPSPALDVLYAGVMEPMHSRLCELWAKATGRPADSEQTKLRIFSLLSQVLVFRMARAGALRRMGWEEVGPREFAMILANVNESLSALIARERQEQPT
jgi:AcrR family transcriptional regulator